MFDHVNHLNLNAHKMTMGGEGTSESNILLTFDKQVFANIVSHLCVLFFVREVSREVENFIKINIYPSKQC